MMQMLKEKLTTLKGMGRFSESAAHVIGLILLGVILNLAALHVVDCLRTETHSHERISPIGEVVRMDIRIVRGVAVRAFRKIGNG